MDTSIDRNIAFLENKLKSPGLSEAKKELYNRLLSEQRKFKDLNMDK
jgi:hypothetical protein